jgi:hypothetical protein
MVHRSRRALENHYGWFNAKAREADCNDDSISLLEGAKINLARSRFYDSQTNRETVDRSSSRSAQDSLEAVAVKNRKLRNFWRPIGPIILFPAMIMHFLTRLAKAGTRGSAKRVCWCQVNCLERHFRIISTWIPNPEKTPGTPPARRGYRRMGSTIICC